ncbi:MAG: MFS transporter [Pseudomonadota bacterium]
MSDRTLITNSFSTTQLSAGQRVYPWIVWFLASSFIFYKYVLQVSPSIMVNELMHVFSLTGATMGNLAAFYFYAYLLMQIPAGVLLDRYNPKYLIACAIVVCAIGAFIFAHAQQYPIAAIGRLLIGLGGAFSAVGAMKLISLWFPAKKFALVSGLMMTMAMLGAMGGEAPLAIVMRHYGWRQTMLDCFWLGIILAVLFVMIIKSDQVKKNISKKITTFRQIGLDFKKLMANKSTWLIAIYSGLAFAPISAFAGLWGIPFLMQAYGINRELTASLVSLVFIGFAAGCPFAGWLSDKIAKRKPLMIIGTSMTMLLLTLIIYFNYFTLAQLAVVLCGFGFFAGFFFISFAYIRELHPTYMSGTSIAFINLFNASMGAIFEPLIGKLLDIGWQHRLINGIRFFSLQDYQHALFVLILALIVALLMQLLIKETHCMQVHKSIDHCE